MLIDRGSSDLLVIRLGCGDIRKRENRDEQGWLVRKGQEVREITESWRLEFRLLGFLLKGVGTALFPDLSVALRRAFWICFLP